MTTPKGERLKDKKKRIRVTSSSSTCPNDGDEASIVLSLSERVVVFDQKNDNCHRNHHHHRTSSTPTAIATLPSSPLFHGTTESNQIMMQLKEDENERDENYTPSNNYDSCETDDDDDVWLLPPPPPTTRRYISSIAFWNPSSAGTPLRQQHHSNPSNQHHHQHHLQQSLSDRMDASSRFSCRLRRRQQQQRRRNKIVESKNEEMSVVQGTKRSWRNVLFGSTSKATTIPSAATTTTTATTTNITTTPPSLFDNGLWYKKQQHPTNGSESRDGWWLWREEEEEEEGVYDCMGQENFSSRKQQRRMYASLKDASSSSSSSSKSPPPPPCCLGFHMALATAFTCTSIATTIPMTLIPSMARDFYFLSSSSSSSTTTTTTTSMASYVSALTSQAVSYAVLGTACGKFLTGWMVDVIGARRMSRLHSIGLGLSLLALALSPTTKWALVTCFAVEFFQAIQWPSLLVILATHHQQPLQEQDDNQQDHHRHHDPAQSPQQNSNDDKKNNINQSKVLYEQGIYMTSLTSRLGCLLIIPFCSWYLRQPPLHSQEQSQHYHHWRQLACGAAMLAWLGSILTTCWIQDAPHQINQPQNPIHPQLLQDFLRALQRRFGSVPVTHRQHRPGNGLCYDDDSAMQPQLDLLDIRRHYHSYTRIDDTNGRGNNDCQVKNNDSDVLGSVSASVLRAVVSIVQSILMTHLIPSLQYVATSGIFWMIAIAHVGSSLVRTSDRILATYFMDTFSHWQVGTTTTTTTTTSSFHLTSELASTCSVSLSVGMMLGLTMAGSHFQALRHQQRRRKRLVTRLYLVTIASCYMLAILSMLSPPATTTTTHTHHWSSWWWWWPTSSGTKTTENNNNNNAELIFIFQVMASVAMGFGIAVPYYQIPSLVIADSFGHIKGLASSYMDGVAYGLSSVVWHVVGATVANRDDDPNYNNSAWIMGTTTSGNDSSGSGISSHLTHNIMGWAYGWSAVALMVVVSGITMIEFMEHYYVRRSGRYGGTYETILLA